jgi:hypothetical protein
MARPAKSRRPPRVLDNEVFVSLEQELGLERPSELFRNSLSSYVFDYLWQRQIKSPKEANVRKRLEDLKRKAHALRVALNANAAHVAAKASRAEAFQQLWNRKLEGDEFLHETQKLIDKLPNDVRHLKTGNKRGPTRRGKTHDLDEEEAVLCRIRRLTQRNIGLNLESLSADLETFCEFVGTYKKSKGGRPRSDAWNDLMRNVARLYEEIAGKPARVSKNEHRAEFGEFYSGPFFRFAAILDGALSHFVFSDEAHPRPNSALGPALKRAIASPNLSRRSKTPH